MMFTLQEAHVNACYKHFYFFVVEFKLIESKEFEPLVSSCHGDCDLSIFLVATSNSQAVSLIRVT